MTKLGRDSQLPPPPSGETEAGPDQSALPASGDPGPGQRAKPVLIGLLKFVIWMSIPIVMVLILAIVAQMVISGH